MKTFSVCHSMHAALFKRYDMASSSFVSVGDVKGEYAPEDSRTGAEYRCLGDKASANKVSHSSDFKPGLFYPPTVFIWGVDENGDPLPHEVVEAFCKQMRYTSTRRVLLPKGYAGTGSTWDNAVMFTPVEAQPYWHSIESILAQQFPKDEVYREAPDFVTVFVDEKD